MATIIYETLPGIGIIRLNRPEVYNSFNREMSLALQSQLDNCEADSSVRAIYLTGVGKGFCAGQDLSEAVDTSGPGIATIVREHYNPIIIRLRSIEKPIICGVNGVAAGAGANIALACDICLAAENATFIQAFSKIGLIPDSGGTFTLPRLIGLQRATALMMLGEKVTAKAAEEMGMIYKSIPAENFENTALSVVAQMAGMPTVGLGLTKRGLNKSLTSDLTEQLDFELELQVAATRTEDYKEGVTAFLQKRSPAFKGT